MADQLVDNGIQKADSVRRALHHLQQAPNKQPHPQNHHEEDLVAPIRCHHYWKKVTQGHYQWPNPKDSKQRSASLSSPQARRQGAKNDAYHHPKEKKRDVEKQ